MKVVKRTGSWQAATFLIYLGVGNGSVWNRSLRGPQGGEDLYLASVVALRLTTGEPFSAEAFTTLNWATGIDPKAARAIETPDARLGRN